MRKHLTPGAIVEECAVAFAEDYQALIQDAQNAAGRPDSLALLLTASQFAEGVSTVCLSLGLFLTSVYDPTDVLVVEANLRRPAFQSVFGLKVKSGLQEALLESAPIEETIVRSGGPGVYLLPSNAARDGSDMLSPASHGERFAQLIETLRKGFRFVIADSPPVNQYMDACAVSSAFDGVIFLVEANRTRAEVADYSLERLRASGAEIMGVILNKRDYHIPNFLYRLL